MSSTYRAMVTSFRVLQRSPARRLAARTAPRNDRGHRMDPDTALLMWFSRIEGEPDHAVRTEADARATMEQTCAAVAGPERILQEVRSVTGGPCPARLYVPLGDTRGRLLVYFHGGGWVVGSLDSHDRLCQTLAADGQQRVLSVDYRLAPEHPFPEPVYDAIDTVRWAREHADALGADPALISVGGDSAGGNLAAVVCLQLRDAREPQPAFQLLIYPATDFRRITPAHHFLGDDYMPTRRTLDWYEARYAPEIRNPLCSPLLAERHEGLARAIIANAGFDPLRDDGEWYARALRTAGGRVDQYDHPGLIHGFASMTGLVPAAARAVEGLCQACTRAYG